MKTFRRIVALASAALLAFCVVTGGLAAWRAAHPVVPDRTGSFANINVLFEKPADWRRLVDDPPFAASTFPRIDGSTVTVPMTMELARQLMGATEDQAIERSFHSTTHQAYVNLIDGLCDVILVTEPSEAELALARDKGVVLEVVPFARDAFVFITHVDNPVASLTVAQVQGIYQSRIRNWKEVGGADARIVAFQREANSGSQTTMEQQVMKGLPMSDPERIRAVVGMGELVDSVAEYRNAENAIGYTFEYYIRNLYRSQDIREIPIDGIAPTFDALRDGSYPFTASYFVVVRSDDTGAGRDIRDFLLSDAGQRCVAQAGYCPLREVD